MDVNQGVEIATSAVQAHERLHLYVKQNRNNYSQEAFQNSVDVLDQLKGIRSEVEGSHVKFEKVVVDRCVLQDKLRPTMLMHVPGSMTEEVKMSLYQNIEAAFKGTCKEVVFAGLITCPWYLSTQTDRGLQAKYNNIFVVYQYKSEQLFTPVTPHENEQNQVIEEEWFYASEVSHFCNYLLRGSVRFVECLHLPDGATIYENQDWMALKQQLKSVNLTKLRGFLEQCRGQAIGSVAKKRKSGQLGLKDGATLHNFCDSYRLLLHAHSSLQQDTIHMGQLTNTLEALTEVVRTAHQMSCDMYQENNTKVTKDGLFDTLLNWKSEVDLAMKKIKFTNSSNVETVLCEWQYKTRCGERIPQSLAINQPDIDKVSPLMTRIGGNISRMDPAQILMVAQAGSYLYSLHTPQSDVDFVVIYADDVKTTLGSCKRPSESFEKRGPDLNFEYGAYEARLFAEMLWKGSVVILELVFAEDLEYTSSMWTKLTQNKHLFLTERAIVQYFGLIKNNMVFIENEKYKDQPRERKLFYQIFHKLDSLEYFLRGKIPPIKCSGSVKDFIMRIRRDPLEGEISRSNLYKLAKEKSDSLKKRLSDRTKRLPENVDYTFLQQWLMSVKGWTT